MERSALSSQHLPDGEAERTLGRERRAGPPSTSRRAVRSRTPTEGCSSPTPGVPAQGNLSDIADCNVNESVSYPGTKNPYIWPSPPWQTSTFNPTTRSAKASLGTLTDVHHTGSFNLPYTTAQFDATQDYNYARTGGAKGDLDTNIDIHREVDQSGRYYTYKITKSGASVSCTLGVNCYNH